MGIKDKVLDILFDDDDEQTTSSQDKTTNQSKKDVSASSFLDTGSIFIDATSPLPKSHSNQNTNNQENIHQEPKPVNESGYQLSENISPIFGVIDSKNKKNKNISKIKSYNDISTKKFDSNTKNSSPAYTSVVISPIFGPISTKPIKKTSKPRKKSVDPFDRDINDTGSFDSVIDETEEEVIAPDFEETDNQEEYVELTDTTGDTDRLVKISDKINRIKNEAANIYQEDNTEDIDEDDHNVETIGYDSISDVIHSFQKYDGVVKQKPQKQVEVPPVEEPVDEPVANEEMESFDNENEPNLYEDTQNNESFEEEIEIEEPQIEEPTSEPVSTTFEEADNTDDFVSNNNDNTSTNDTDSKVSVDDIFQDEDAEEGKDLFSVLFGDD